MVKLLIDAAPDSVRHGDNQGGLPLHVLCLNHNLDDGAAIDILKLLLERCPESARHDIPGSNSFAAYSLKHIPNRSGYLIMLV